MINGLAKLEKTVIFYCRQAVSAYLLAAVLACSVILITFFFLQFMSASGTSGLDDREMLLFSVKLLVFLMQFIICLFSLVLGLYLFNDPAAVFLVTSSKSRVTPVISQYVSLLVILNAAASWFTAIFLACSFLFLSILPAIDALVIIVLVNFLCSLLFSSVTLASHTILVKGGSNVSTQAIIPVVLFFIIPNFFYTGITFGVFPEALYAFTFQYHLSMLANYLLESPYAVYLPVESFLSSTLLLILSSFVSLAISAVLTERSDYR